MFFGVWKVTQRTNLTEKTTLRIFLNIFRFLYNFILYISSSSSEVPRYCFIRALELLERYRNPPLVPQLILPSMTISCPVLNNVTVRITSLGLDVMNGQQRHSGLFKALLHLVTQFLAFSGVSVVFILRARHSKSWIFFPCLKAARGGFGKILPSLWSMATIWLWLSSRIPPNAGLERLSYSVTSRCCLSPSSFSFVFSISSKHLLFALI